jgi:hypothetical protein
MGRLVTVAVAPRRTLSKQSLWGQVSAKLTPEISINNASSYSRLTAADHEPQPQIAIHRTVSRLFFFLFFSSFDETTTELELEAEGLKFHLNLGFLFCFVFGFWFFVCFFCLFVLVFGFFSPLIRQ